MQNNYVKELAVKTYQEDLQKEYVKSKARPFHAPSFIGGSTVVSRVGWVVLANRFVECLIHRQLSLLQLACA